MGIVKWKWCKTQVMEQCNTCISQLLLFSLSHVPFFATLWTTDHQAPLSRQEYWSRLPFPPPWDLPHPVMNLPLLHSRRILNHWATREAHILARGDLLLFSSLASHSIFWHRMVHLATNLTAGDFPDGPKAKTPSSQSRRAGFNPWWRN